MSTELLPCPFCGGTDVASHKFDTDLYCVECNNDECQIVGPNGITKAGAISAWNRRATVKESFTAQPAERLCEWKRSNLSNGQRGFESPHPSLIWKAYVPSHCEDCGGRVVVKP